MKAGASGIRAGSGGYSYLLEPYWWAGMLTMIVGEAANFAAYAYAPAILVTPLGALSIIFSIVLHAPLERKMESVKEVWHLATQPGFIIYTCLVVCLVLLLIFRFVPRYGQSHLIVYIGICSLTGSLTVMGVKAVGIALKLSVEDSNQFKYFQTWFFTVCVIIFCLLQLNYLNKALDCFNTAVVSPVYYVMFTTLTIVASVIMFKDWDHQTVTQIVTEFCGFITILSGTFLLHKTKDMGGGTKASTVTPDSETTREAPPKSRPEGPEDV
nr:probable magnesium transporter NIPA2 [Ipomoea batatas]GMD74504.1 probable magnesium transporter NIPA2 [Ipomoea batatas]